MNTSSVLLAIIISERLDALYKTDDYCKTNAALLEQFKQYAITCKQPQNNSMLQQLETDTINDIQIHIQKLNELSYEVAFRDAYNLFISLNK